MRNKPDNSDLVKDRCVDLEPEIRAFLFGILRDTHEVEDAFQRTVVKAIEASADVNAETLRGWLFKIALNEARAFKRSQSLAKAKIEDWKQQFGQSSTAGGGASLDGIISAERQESIDSAVMRLPKNQREVIERRMRNGQKFADIAIEMNRPLGTILTWMRRALNSLREMQEIRELNPDAGHSASGNSAADENR
ncbi:MAG: RNA polymerase sigma factor [Fuerstiella sp.]